MTVKLQALSILAGFKALVTAYSFRHMAAKALEAAGGKTITSTVANANHTQLPWNRLVTCSRTDRVVGASRRTLEITCTSESTVCADVAACLRFPCTYGIFETTRSCERRLL